MASRMATLFSRKDGSVEAVNPRRLNEIPYFLQTNPPNNSLVMPANGTSPQTVISISGEGPAAVFGFTAERTGVCKILLQIQDGPKIRALMNRSCHIDTIFGSYAASVFGNRAYYLPEALYIDEQRAVLATATDISGSSNAARLNMESERLLTRRYDHQLAKLRASMDKRQYLTLPHFYTLDSGSSVLAAGIGNTNTETISIGGEFHFELFQLSCIAQQGPNSFAFNIVDAITGEPLIDMPLGETGVLSAGLICGNAGFPMRFHEPRFFSIRSKLIVTLVNRSAAQNEIFLTLGGRDLADRMWS